MSNQLSLQEVPLRAPIANKNGMVGDIWARWFLRVYAQVTGLGTGLTDEFGLLGPLGSITETTSNSNLLPPELAFHFTQDIAPPFPEFQMPQEFAPPVVFDQAQELQTRIECLESYIAVLETRLSNLEAGTLL